MYDLNRSLRMAVMYCESCMKRNNIGTGTGPWKHSFATRPLDRVHLDLIGKFPRRTPEGYFYVLSVIDSATRHLTTIPLTTNNADNILDKLICYFFNVYGYPRTIVTDRANELIHGSVKEYCERTGILLLSIPSHHPCANGIVERVQRSIKSYLGKLCGDRMFRLQDLAACTYHYNVSRQNSMKENPYFMMFNRDPTIEATLHYQPDVPLSYADSTATDCIVRNHQRRMYAQEQLNATFDRVDKLRPKEYKNFSYREGDAILCRNFQRKLKSEAEFLSNYTIVEKINDYSYYAKNNATGRVTMVHINDIKLDRSKTRKTENKDDKREDGKEEGTDMPDDVISNSPFEDDQTDNQQTDLPPTYPSENRIASRPKRSIRAPDRLGVN